MLNLRIKDGDEKRLLEYFKNVPTQLDKYLKPAAAKVANQMRNEIVVEWPVASERSRQSITIQEIPGRGYEVVALEDHAKYVDNIDPSVEYVRRPGSKPPPTDAIKEWIEQINLSYSDITLDQLAYLIARKIARDGKKNPRIFYRAYLKGKILWEKEITIAANKAMQNA